MAIIWKFSTVHTVTSGIGQMSDVVIGEKESPFALGIAGKREAIPHMLVRRNG